MKILFLTGLLVASIAGFSQSVAINNDNSLPDPSSLLDLKSNNKGLLLPRMTKIQKNNVLNPAEGLLVFQTGLDSIGFHYYSNNQWIWLDPFLNAAWKINGNSNTDTANNFIGTTDNMPLRFKQNNQQLGLWDLSKANYFLGRAAGKNKPAAVVGSIAIGDSAFASAADNVSPAASSYNIAIGHRALLKHKKQMGNVAIGAFSMQNFVEEPSGGFGSVSIGYSCYNFLKSGDANVAVGTFALLSDTIGFGNTAVGYEVFGNKLNGNRNTAIGLLAGLSLRVSNENSFLGANANSSKDSLVNATSVGARAQVDTSNAMVLGSINGINSATASVNVAIGTTKPKAALHVSRGNSGNSITVPSNRTMILEDNTSSYLQLLTPGPNESGILAGNDVSLIKSGMVFQADSSIGFRTGGNTTRMTIDKTGAVGINMVGINPRSKLEVNGSFGNAIRVTNSSTTLNEFDHTIVFDNSTVGVVVSLPLASASTNREYVIVNQGSSNLNCSIAYKDFAGANTTIVPANSSITIQSSGTFWHRTR